MPTINQLTSLTNPANADTLAIVDNTGAITKKIRRDDLLKGTDLPTNTVTTAAIADGAATPAKRAGGFKVGTFTTPAATGNYTVSGVGFMPKLVRFSSSLNGVNDSFATFNNGAMDSSGSQYTISSISSSTASRTRTNSSRCVASYDNSGGVATLIFAASYVSMNADGFTINVTDRVGNTSFIAWEAYS